jgi:hypothetical protein
MLAIAISIFTGGAFLVWYAKERRLGTHLLSAWIACTCVSLLLSLFSSGLAAIAATIFTLDTLVTLSQKKGRNNGTKRNNNRK